MRINGLVITEKVESFQGKRGRVELPVLVILDRDTDVMQNTMDYVLSEEERAKYYGKAVGKTIALGVTDAKTDFGGRLRLSGRILEVK